MKITLLTNHVAISLLYKNIFNRNVHNFKIVIVIIIFIIYKRITITIIYYLNDDPYVYFL